MAPLKPADTAAPAAPDLDTKEGGERGEKAAAEGDAASREVFQRVRAEAETAARRERQARQQVWAVPHSRLMLYPLKLV